jgi:ATP-dependent DNA helicase RecG
LENSAVGLLDIEKEFVARFGKEFGINDKQLLLTLDENPSLTASDISERIGVSPRAIEKQIKKFKDLGVICRQGSRKNGLWIINEIEL